MAAAGLAPNASSSAVPARRSELPTIMVTPYHLPPAFCLSMIFSENRFPLFGIML
jgi:hypothetical protein